MDAVRRHETPGSENKDFIIHDIRRARALCFHLFFLSVSAFSEVIKRGPGGYNTHNRFTSQVQV